MRFLGEFAIRRDVGRSCWPGIWDGRCASVVRTRSRPAVGIYIRDEHLWDLRGINARRTDPPWPPLRRGGRRGARSACARMSIYGVQPENALTPALSLGA